MAYFFASSFDLASGLRKAFAACAGPWMAAKLKAAKSSARGLPEEAARSRPPVVRLRGVVAI